MKLAVGNMFDHPADLILVTTNSYVRSNGTLVMGRGAAAELSKRYFLNAESVFGARVMKYPGLGVYKKYGVIVDEDCTYNTPIMVEFGIFQVKYHWGKPAVPDLISYSAQKLCEIAHEYKSISLNYPGIGNGGLDKSVVGPLIECLPGNVTVFERG